MATQRLQAELEEFLKLLNSRRVEYLLIGGYAVGYYGYPRATADMDVWVAMTARNAAKLVSALRKFGFAVPALEPELFLQQKQDVRLGEPPLRIQILTSISGLKFADCYPRRKKARLDGLRVDVVSLQDLKRNKAASGRPKDLDDLEHLQQPAEGTPNAPDRGLIGSDRRQRLLIDVTRLSCYLVQVHSIGMMVSNA